MARRIALVTPDLTCGGGVAAVVEFLYRVLRDSDRYTPDIITLAVSARDAASVRLASPSTWFGCSQVTPATWRSIPCRHVGGFLVEVESQRYQPRPKLNMLLEDFDLVQIVAGTPAWGHVAGRIKKPVCLFVATTVRRERQTLLNQGSPTRRLWLKVMTALNARIEKRALLTAKHIFAESRYTCDQLRAVVDNTRLSLGVPGIDTDLYFPGDSRAHGYILTVSRLNDPRKNVRMLFEAYHRLRQIMPNAPELVLVGRNGPSAADWEAAGSLDIVPHIKVHKNVSSHELAALYRGASLFVLSSNEEGLGVVILEAMASGLPVISTRCGGPETLITEGITGCLTPIGDAPAMAEAMRSLLFNPELLASMGRAGRQLAEQRFSLSAAGAVYLNKYDEILGSEPV